MCTVAVFAQMLQFIDQSRARAANAGFASPAVRSGPVSGAAAEAAPSEVEQLLGRAQGIAHVQLPLLEIAEQLKIEGGVFASDFVGITAVEAQDIWKPLADLPLKFVEAFLLLCQRCHIVAAAPSVSPGAGSSAGEAVQDFPDRSGPATDQAYSVSAVPAPADVAAAQAALKLCTVARSTGQVPEPAVLADSILSLAKADVDIFASPRLPPRQEVVRKQAQRTDVLPMAEQAVWLEFCGWRASARGYASAVRLYGRVVVLCACAAWPPTQVAIDVYVGLFRSAATLSRYLSHLRTVLLWLRAPLGPLADTTQVARGAEKAGRSLRRPRVRATAAETKALARWCVAFGFVDVGESWVVARHFCLRYGEVLQIGSSTAPVCIEAAEGAPKTVAITFMRRKCYAEPVQVVRKCICRLQGKALCGVCIICSRQADADGRLFSGVSYSESLATLKIAAQACGFDNASAWGTHAFRRGWATECLQANGPTALFYSGGWRGLSAFAYASARARGGIAAAEFLIEHSESSDAAD